MLNPIAYHCPAHLFAGSSKIKDFVALLRIKEKVEDEKDSKLFFYKDAIDKILRMFCEYCLTKR